MTLTEFLLARIAEDQRHARVATPGPWEAYCHDGRLGAEYIVGVSGLDGRDVLEDRDCFRADAAHIARHSPVRVLADCDAKRRVVGRLMAAKANPDDYHRGAIAAYENAVKDLAAAYGEHPDYRQEWTA